MPEIKERNKAGQIVGDPVKKGKFKLEKQQYDDMRKLTSRFIKFAKMILKGKLKDSVSVKREDISQVIKEWLAGKDASIYFHKKKNGVEYGFDSENRIYFKEKQIIGKQLLDKIHPDKKATSISFDIQEIEVGLRLIKEALE